jgi:hypothetical protein
MLSALALVHSACSTIPAPPPPPPAAPVQPVFEFHSSPWLNLHLALYREAILRKTGRATPPPADFAADERAAWDAAVTTYVDTVIAHDLLFDDNMVRVGLDLDRLEDAPRLDGFIGPTSLAHTLESAMPAYRAHRWPDDDAKNRAYSARTQPEVQRVAAAVIPDLVRLYGSPWPTGPIRVDVAAYAGRVGAYTTVDPVHITIAATNTDLEIPFHEASHALMDPIEEAIARELTARKKSARDLWHAVLFYTTGEVVRLHLPGHVPYADANGLWTRGDWPAYRRAIDTAWKPTSTARSAATRPSAPWWPLFEKALKEAAQLGLPHGRLRLGQEVPLLDELLGNFPQKA